MYFITAMIVAVLYIGLVTYLSYQLAKHKTNEPYKAAVIGFLLCFLPPLSLIYLVILLLKSDVDVI